MGMDKQCYSDAEAAVIDGVIASLFSRMASDKQLQDAYATVHEHLRDGAVDTADLKRIDNILALAGVGRQTELRKETQRDFLSVHLKTRAMLRAAQRSGAGNRTS